jgi:hypothetical protein
MELVLVYLLFVFVVLPDRFEKNCYCFNSKLINCLMSFLRTLSWHNM